jgi:glycosyltransferase involved in cell wall biosynthesis
VARYKVDAGKIVVVPFGANIESRSFHEVEADIRARKGEQCQLTFLGIDCIRKGAPAAYSLMDRLNREGCPTTLNTIGGDARRNPPSGAAYLFELRVRGDKRVDVAGFLDKSRRLERDRLFRILAQTHFLIHPAEFECFGIALAEANAFGVPVLAVDKFGPKTIIRNGVNGHLFSPEDFVTEASRFILDLQRNFDDYQELAQTAFAEYQSRLNWDVSVNRLLNAINQL